MFQATINFNDVIGKIQDGTVVSLGLLASSSPVCPAIGLFDPVAGGFRDSADYQVRDTVITRHR